LTISFLKFILLCYVGMRNSTNGEDLLAVVIAYKKIVARRWVKNILNDM
jgi:hypothetical protein